jgi:hypothetical protein
MRVALVDSVKLMNPPKKKYLPATFFMETQHKTRKINTYAYSVGFELDLPLAFGYRMGWLQEP